MAAAVALVVEVLALAPTTAVSAAKRLEELAALGALVDEEALRLAMSPESEAVSAGRRTAELEILVAPWIPELDQVQHRCPSQRHLGLHYGPRLGYQSRPCPRPLLLLVRTPAGVRHWNPE